MSKDHDVSDVKITLADGTMSKMRPIRVNAVGALKHEGRPVLGIEVTYACNHTITLGITNLEDAAKLTAMLVPMAAHTFGLAYLLMIQELFPAGAELARKLNHVSKGTPPMTDTEQPKAEEASAFSPADDPRYRGRKFEPHAIGHFAPWALMDHLCELVPADSDLCDYSYHSPTQALAEVHQELRVHALHLATHIRNLCPNTRETVYALDRLREAVMWANASIAQARCHGATLPEDDAPGDAAEGNAPAGDEDQGDEQNPAEGTPAQEDAPMMPPAPLGIFRTGQLGSSERTGLPLYDELTGRRTG